MEHLRELRERRSLLQKQVADEIGVDRTTYAKYESGASEPSFEILKKLARFYEVTTDYLLDFETALRGPSLVLSEEEERIILNYRNFNPKGQEKLREEIYVMAASGIYKNSNDISCMANT